MDVRTAADQLIKINDDMGALIDRYARSEKELVKLWMCELLADLADRKNQIIKEYLNDGADSMD